MKMMLIGGGEIGRGNTSYETEKIDFEIVQMSGVEHPNFLFIGLASSYADSYYDVIKKVYKNLGCLPNYLKKNNLIHNPDLVKEKIKQADIIYIGGGDTIKLMDKVQEYQLAPLFLEALNRGCVFAGISAGAILLSKRGFSDSYILRGESEHYSFVDGLGFIDVSICPHYEKDSLKREELFDIMKEEPDCVYGISNCAALKVVDDKLTVIRSKENAHVYEVSYSNQVSEKEL